MIEFATIDWRALIVTLKLAALTTVVLVVIGVPLAIGLSRMQGRAKWIVDALVAIPLVLPPTVLGFYLLMLLGRAGPLGSMWDVLGVRLPFTFAALLIGSVLFNLPLAVRPFTVAFTSVPKSLVEASWCLGVSRWGTFWRVTLPLAMPGILAGAATTFANTLGEFGVVLMLGGNIPGETRTLSIALYDQLQALDYAAANRTALILICVSALSLVLMHVANRRLVAGRTA
jgi:molybdate transport system permease protein